MAELAVIQGGLQDPYLPLPDGVSLDGVWLVLEGQVNMNDLIKCGPGSIVRMREPDAVKYIPGQLDDYERVAGMISDAA